MDDNLHSLFLNKINICFAPYPDRILFIDRYKHDQNMNPVVVGYCNAHTICLAQESRIFYNALKNNTINFADGIGVRLAFRLFNEGSRIKSQNATDFYYAFLDHAHKNKMRVYFVGSTDDNLKEISKNIIKDYPGIVIAGMQHGYGDGNNSAIIESIQNAHADVLMVGMGQPMQELWISKNIERINVPLIMSVGGFLDYYSGGKLRAPKILRMLGLEWLFRLIIEPRRLWRRYIIGIPHFCWIIAKEKYHQ